MAKNSGVLNLVNTKEFPFNDSLVTVALPAPLDRSDYDVYTSVLNSTGETGDIVISGKARNGFKIAYTGSASQVELLWKVEVCTDENN